MPKIMKKSNKQNIKISCKNSQKTDLNFVKITVYKCLIVWYNKGTIKRKDEHHERFESCLF